VSKNIEKKWSTDWYTFAEQLIELLDAGVSDADISAQFRGKEVQWEGLITDVKLDDKWVPLITLSMAEQDMPMANNRVLSTSHIVLSIPPGEQESWLGSEVGESITFAASIPLFDEYTNEIQFNEMEGDPLVCLELRLVECKRTNHTPLNKGLNKTVEPEKVTFTERATVMQADNLMRIIQRFRELCEESIAAGTFSETAYEEIIKGCDALRNNSQYETWGESLALMIEDYDDKVDLSEGYPGYFGHALESGDLKSFCKLCIDSLKRKPTGLMVGLLSRVYRDHGDDYGLGLDIFESVMKHPLANVAAKEIAEDLL